MSIDGTPQLKLPYSKPRLTRHSPASLADALAKRDVEKGRPDKDRRADSTQPPLLIVEGVRGVVEELAAALSRIDGCSRGGDPRDGEIESLAEKDADPCLLLVDMRRPESGRRQPVIRIETDAISNGTLAVILTEAGEQVSALSENRNFEQWHIGGSMTPHGLGILIRSACEIWSGRTETRSKAGSSCATSDQEAPATSYAGRY